MAESEEIRQRRIEGQRNRRDYEAGKGPVYEQAVTKHEQELDKQAREVLQGRGLKGKELEEAVKKAAEQRPKRGRRR